jgi:hypothetical protein
VYIWFEGGGGLKGEVIREIRGIRERGGKERQGEVFGKLPKVRDRRFWTWFARVRKYFVRNEKFRSEILRFQEGSKVLEVLKLEGFNLKVKLKLKCLRVFQRVEWWSSRRWGSIRQVPKGKGLSIPDGGLLWCFAEGVQPCRGAIFDVRNGQMADRLVVIGKKQYLSSLWNRIIGKGDC